MTKTKKIFLMLIAMAVIITGCGKKDPFSDIVTDITLDSTLTHSDKLISINFKQDVNAGAFSIAFSLRNNIDTVLTLIWDEVFIIDIKGETQSVFIEGMKYNERDKPKPNVKIIKGALYKNSASPQSYAYIHPFSNRWRMATLFSDKNAYEMPDEDKEKIIKFVLPLQIGDGEGKRVFNYVFSMKMKDLFHFKVKK